MPEITAFIPIRSCHYPLIAVNGSTLIHSSKKSLLATLPWLKWWRFHCWYKDTLCSKFPQPCELYVVAKPLGASFHKTFPPCEFPCSWFIWRCQDLNDYLLIPVWVFAKMFCIIYHNNNFSFDTVVPVSGISAWRSDRAS